MTARSFSSQQNCLQRHGSERKAMKRFLTILLSSLLICGLFTACGTKELSDGNYTIEVTLTGGSGRASVDSPTQIKVEGEKITATVVWSSPFYEYMLVDGVRYEPVQTQGNSTFEIPVVLDEDIPVSATTIAMSEPHLVDYILHFDGSTMKGE